MGKVHMILQGKGGVGKSFISALLAQYQKAKGQTPLCIDTDPVNGTFHGYEGLNVVRLEVLEGQEIVPRKFDMLVQLIGANYGDNDVIIDNGASTFVPLSHYLISHGVAELLREMGHELIIHTIVTGGQAQDDTVNGFVHLAEQLPEPVKFIVWLNEYWGPIIEGGKAGFEEFKAYRDNLHRVLAIVKIPELPELFRRDLTAMLRQRLTFAEALTMASFWILSRQRLIMIQRQLFGLMDIAVVL